MTADTQLAYESRVAPRQAAVAVLAAILLVGAAAVQISGPHTKVNELTLDLITAHKRYPLDVIGAVINALGLAALGATLAHLFRITRARNPDLKSFIPWLVGIGAVIAGVTGVVYAVIIASKATDFVGHGAQTYQQANHLTSSSGLLALPFLGQAAALALAVGFVLAALQAMRVGLLTRFMGYLGIFTGILVLFPIGSPVPVVQAFWLLALAYLLIGRWPSGLPPSWRSGRAEPWPSGAELREQRARAAGGRGARAASDGAGAGGSTTAPRAKPKPEAPETVAAGPAPRTRSGTPKRKRKRRR